MTNNFWAKKLAKQQQSRSVPSVRPQNGPWWLESQSPIPDHRSRVPTPQIGLQSRKGLCPGCGGDNYSKPDITAAERCFECGFVNGRNIHDAVYSSPAITTGPARQARQTKNGGGIINNYHRITTAEEAVDRVG